MQLVTFISCFRKFMGDYALIQHSALFSWQVNGIPVIVPDNEVGVRENCSQYSGVVVISGVKRGWDINLKTGAVLLPSLIDKVLPLINTPMVALVGSDMIIPENFNHRLEAVLKTSGFDSFLASTRHNIKLLYRISSEESYKKIQKEAWPLREGFRPDLMIMSKYWLKAMRMQMPDFIIGRCYWKDWIYEWACRNIPKREDCTLALPVLHCDHDSRLIYLQEGKHGMDAPSSKYNASLWECCQFD